MKNDFIVTVSFLFAVCALVFLYLAVWFSLTTTLSEKITYCSFISMFACFCFGSLYHIRSGK